MKFFFLSLFLTLVSASSAWKSVYATEVILAADAWCPVNCEPDSSHPGIMIEIAKRIFQEKGHSIKYIKVPWVRAIKMANDGEINGIVGAFYGDARNFIYPKNEQLIMRNSYYVLAESKWEYKSMHSLDDRVLGYVVGYDYGEKLNQYIKNAPEKSVFPITGDEDLMQRLLTLLEKKRVDVIIEANLVFEYSVNKLAVSDKFRFAGEATEELKAYIAFSPVIASSIEYARILSDGMIKLERSGELKEISQAYGVH